jgi:NAD(P)H dehydrogenase (quinone)
MLPEFSIKSGVGMQIMVILGHPNKASFNHAIAAEVVSVLEANGHTVHFHDLYSEGFDPILSGHELGEETVDGELAKAHCNEIVEADGIIVIHPNWWGQPPAIMKGWIDRVFRHGIAYEFDEGDSGGGVPRGLLRATKAIVFSTSNTYAEREARMFGDPLGLIWNNCVFRFCGVKSFERRMFRVIADSSPQDRQKWLAEVRELVQRNFPRG